jgi:hypothetical protein
MSAKKRPNKTGRKGNYKGGAWKKARPIVRRQAQTLAGKKIKHVFNLTPEKRKALEMLFAGESVETAAREAGVTSRSVRVWREQFAKLFLENSSDWIEIWTTTVQKSLSVIDKYLSGKGGLPGGDLQAALAVLKGSHILQPDHKISVNSTKNLVQFQRYNVTVNSQIDKEFNDSLPTEFQRMVRILKIPASTTGTDS